MKLITLAKQTDRNHLLLYSHGLVKLVLGRFKQVLADGVVDVTKNCPAELTLLLDLFLVLSQHSFSSRDLLLLLRLFGNSKSVAMDLLLNTLLVLAENMCTQPTYTLSFPVMMSLLASDLELTSRSLSDDTLTISIQAHHGTKSKEVTLG